MKLRAGARKKRRLDDQTEPPPEHGGVTRRREPRQKHASPINQLLSTQIDEPGVSNSIPRADFASSETLLPVSEESILPTPQQSFESEASSPDDIGLPNEEETVRSLPRAPLSGYDLDRLNYHIDLQDFGRSLQKAANAVFSSDRRSRYTQVSALLLSWEDEDPKLPVSLEIRELKDVFVNLYGFDVEEWRIPAVNSHVELNMKVLQFLKDSGNRHLKIVYYAGHGKLSNHGQALWTSHRDKRKERPPTVKWSGIQNALEESPSDVLILLDCCASGLSNGVTELLAACAFNGIANGVGPYSFTHALISQLRKLARSPSFTVGYLYNRLFTEIQNLRIEDPQKKKAPIHLVLTQDHRLPRSIHVSSKPPQPSEDRIRDNVSMEWVSMGNGMWGFGPNSVPQDSPSSQNTDRANSVFSPGVNDSDSSSSSIMTQSAEYPRILFSIRISEDIKPSELSTELFADWLGTLPMITKSIRVEAGFASDSTLLMVSMPVAFLGYLPVDPAITMLGTTRSANLLSGTENGKSIPAPISVITENPALELQGETQDSGFAEPSMSYQEKEYVSSPGLDSVQTPRRPKTVRRCSSCNRADIPESRQGSDGLCNACGVQSVLPASRSRHGRQAPNPGSPLRQSMSLSKPNIDSPAVQRKLFQTPLTQYSQTEETDLQHGSFSTFGMRRREDLTSPSLRKESRFKDIFDSTAIKDTVTHLISSEPNDSPKLESIYTVASAARWTQEECRLVRMLALEKSPTPPTLELRETDVAEQARGLQDPERLKATQPLGEASQPKPGPTDFHETAYSALKADYDELLGAYSRSQIRASYLEQQLIDHKIPYAPPQRLEPDELADELSS